MFTKERTNNFNIQKSAYLQNLPLLKSSLSVLSPQFERINNIQMEQTLTRSLKMNNSRLITATAS